MGIYGIEIERTAAKAIATLQRADQTRVVSAIRALAADPRPAGCTKLTGADAYRIRVGTHRVVYLIDDSEQVLTITRVGHRRDIYGRM